jgi:hypothetical protein
MVESPAFCLERLYFCVDTDYTVVLDVRIDACRSKNTRLRMGINRGLGLHLIIRLAMVVMAFNTAISLLGDTLMQ